MAVAETLFFVERLLLRSSIGLFVDRFSDDTFVRSDVPERDMRISTSLVQLCVLVIDSERHFSNFVDMVENAF